MLYIEKKNPSLATRRELARIKSTPEWKSIPEGDTKAIRDQFDMLDKSIIRPDLLSEQHHLCAYCMRRITNHGSSTHIEHREALNKHKDKALDYNNFLGVCDGGAGVDISGRRVLSCDANKSKTDGKNTEFVLNPYDPLMMSGIVYTKDGFIKFVNPGPYDEVTCNKISVELNYTLQLNGKLDSNGTFVQDTATQLVKGRKDALINADTIIRALDKKHRLNSHYLTLEIQRLKNKPMRDQYIGVTLFRLQRKLGSLIAQGL